MRHKRTPDVGNSIWYTEAILALQPEQISGVITWNSRVASSDICFSIWVHFIIKVIQDKMWYAMELELGCAPLNQSKSGF